VGRKHCGKITLDADLRPYYENAGASLSYLSRCCHKGVTQAGIDEGNINPVGHQKICYEAKACLICHYKSISVSVIVKVQWP
jgi:hypothetical protein